MEANINFSAIGFDPTGEFLEVLKEELYHLTERCPYDSSLAIQIVRRPRVYEFSILVRFVDGNMEAKSESPILRKAMSQSFDRIRGKIQAWHTARFKQNAMPPSQAASTPELPTEKPHVLIIDDDPMSTQFLDYCLRQSGCVTKNVSSGHSAVYEIASRKYDLIFLDWSMPDMNGGETLLSAQNLISYDREFNRRLSDLKMPVVTYSGKPKKELNLPECRHFRFVDHWDKTTPLNQLLAQASDILFRFKAAAAS